MDALLANSRVIALNVFLDNGQVTDGGCVYAWASPEDITAVPDNASVGDMIINGVAVPYTPVPASVTRGQFKLALLQMDLLDDVEAAIALADRATQINYAERLDFERNHPLVITMATALGKTEAEVDALFILAATL